MMAFLQKLAASLKRGRAAELPKDDKEAFYILMPMVIGNQHRSLADLLSSSKFPVSFQCGRAQRSLLHIAANCGNYDCLCLLLRKGAEINLQDRSGCTPLHLAAKNGQRKCLNKLLEHECDINIRNNEGLTAVHWLAVNGRTELLQDMLSRIRDVDIEDAQGQTPLHVACQNGHLQTLLCLVDNGANVNKANNSGWTPLHFACKHGQHEAVEILLKRGAELWSETANRTPLALCLEEGYGETCEVLLKQWPKLFDCLVCSVCEVTISEENVLKVLNYLSHQDVRMKEKIIDRLSEHVSIIGHHLLSDASQGKEATDSLIRAVRVLLSVEKIQQSSSRRSESQDILDAASEPSRHTPVCERPCMLTLWQLLDDWMMLLDNDNNNPTTRQPPTTSTSATTIKATTTLSPPPPPPPPTTTTQIHNEISNLCLSPSPQPLSANNGTLDNSASGPYANSVRKEVIKDCPPSLLDKGGVKAGREEGGVGVVAPHGASPGKETLSAASTAEGCDGVSGSDGVLDGSSGVSDGGNGVSPDGCVSDGGVSDGGGGVNGSGGGFNSSGGGVSSIVIAGGGPVEQHRLSPAIPQICALIQAFYLCTQPHSCENSKSSSKFFSFLRRHITTMRKFVESDPQLIFNHFHFLLSCPDYMTEFLTIIHSQPFESRRQWFYENLPNPFQWNTPAEEDSQHTVKISREQLFRTSCEEVLLRSPDQLKSTLSVQFSGEEGLGQGLVREWFDLLSREILNPDYALFTMSADGCTFQPNSNSAINPDHLSYFRFAGRLLGLALFHRHLLSTYFTRSFYKHILGVPVNYQDVVSIDPEYAKNLQWLLDHDISDLGLDLTFSIETDTFGSMQEVELKPGGSKVTVTEHNKEEYVQLVTELRMTSAIRPQIDSFMSGFHDYIPFSLVQLFNEYELELLLSGLPEIDLNDWRANTNYTGYSSDTQVIQWFWEVVDSMTEQQRVQLLQFVTGSSRVPYGGFSQLSSGGSTQLFTISRQPCPLTPYKGTPLPTASTCINLLRLPEYPSQAMLENRLLTALRCGSQGYGMV